MDTYGVPILYNSRFELGPFLEEAHKIDPAGFLSENGSETIWVPRVDPESLIPKLMKPIDELEP